MKELEDTEVNLCVTHPSIRLSAGSFVRTVFFSLSIFTNKIFPTQSSLKSFKDAHSNKSGLLKANDDCTIKIIENKNVFLDFIISSRYIAKKGKKIDNIATEKNAIAIEKKIIMINEICNIFKNFIKFVALLSYSLIPENCFKKVKISNFL